MTEDRVDIKVHQAKVEIGIIAIDLAEIGLEGICSRLRAIVKELGDIESTLDLQFKELADKEKKC